MRRRYLNTLVLIAGCSGGSDPTGPDPVAVEERRLEAVTETSLTGIVGIEVRPVPVVRATTLSGSPVSGVEVHFEVSGDGVIRTVSARTDETGQATVGTWTLGSISGAQTLTARSAGLADVRFTVTAEAGPAAMITQVGGDYQAGAPGAALSNPLRVKIADRFGNGLPGTPVSFLVHSGNGAIDGDTRISDSLGVATSGPWTLGATAGMQQVTAEAHGLLARFTAFACNGGCENQQLAFVNNDQIYSLTDVGMTQLTTGGIAGAPAWSPDGRRIAFVRYEQNWEGDLYLMNADGSAPMRWAAGFRSPAWSPDGRTLAAAKGHCVYECDIYLLSADRFGASPVLIATLAKQPAWSPDGSKIAFVSLSGDDGYHALYLMSADGSEVTALTVRDEAAIDHPTWSPDGRRIAFAKCIGGDCNLFVVNLDGSNLVQLTTMSHVSHPAWSPDGARIAFALWNDFRSPDSRSVFYIPPDGSGQPVAMASPGHSPAWRP